MMLKLQLKTRLSKKQQLAIKLKRPNIKPQKRPDKKLKKTTRKL